MPTQQSRQFIHYQLMWMLGALVILSVLQALTLELFFVISLIGLLIMIELTAPIYVTPQWRRRLKWLIGLGLLVFAYIVIRRILAILPPGVI
ncbi:hypothetical protein SAMN05421858_3739 [Haladaptatus litoreus]|uniref:Uncharacterized protein n=1 Tax=Haladaptatus litoreus TaxID=553468 RepID=A0A1N7DLS5_9EURY|nr:hypothetical protein [Haladaptatus litoreus]SIR76813.1 hypothetical protein SAMN05421858_3739 [Haladaptatus litoreus]